MPEAVLQFPRARGPQILPDRKVPLLQSRALTLELGGHRVVDSVDLAVEQGRRVAIMGANGAGKSQLLRMLHGLVQPSGGRIVWKGGALDRSARDRQAMVFQRAVLLRRSVRANLKFALSVKGIRGGEAAARIGEALASARLADFASRPARALSGGEQQRLCVVRALMTQPELLFLDEPTASLDPASTQAIEALIAEANARGVTTVLVTHDAGQARRMADTIAFMHGGRLVECGPADEVLTAPRSEAARAWLDGRLMVE